LRVAAIVFLGYLAVVIGAGWWQLVQAGPLTDDPHDPLRGWVDRNVARGRILDSRGVVVAGNTVRGDGTRVRRYRFPAMASITGYQSALLGTAGLERTYDAQLSGMDGLTAGGGALRKLRDRPFRPVDVRLSVDARFQELAARLLGDRRGAVVAIEPSTGRILALVSSPGFDPSRLADPLSARSYLEQLADDPDSPLLDRATQGRYVPGSVFKLVTATAALGSGAVSPETSRTSRWSRNAACASMVHAFGMRHATCSSTIRSTSPRRWRYPATCGSPTRRSRPAQRRWRRRRSDSASTPPSTSVSRPWRAR
jgi:peptidoglycan glycosyltransferase